MLGPPAKSTLRRASTALLSVLSLLGAFVACEVALRLFHPKYEDVAQSQRYQADESRVWAPMPNTSRYNAHPDTGARHPIIYNNFGSRQHRHFDAGALKHAENVAFFGDSYVENSGIEAQYSFTEVLDFLLNLGGERASHDDRAFNVLNFGVDGYGPGQEFVWYKQFPHREDLDHVFYVFCNNDIENFHHHGLFSLDDSGDLVPNVAVVRGFLTTALSRLHSTYLVLDFGQRLNLREKRDIWTPPPRWYAAPAVSKPIAKIRRRILLRENQEALFRGDAFDDSIAAFQTLLLHWKDVVEEHGGEFWVVVLPYMDRRIVQGIFPEQLEVVYLFDCFDDMIPGFDDADWRFRTDAHWNESGNMMAAHCLYRLLERETKASRLSETALANGLQEYYSAVGTGNWGPPPPPPADVLPATGTFGEEQIAAKYMALDDRRRTLESLSRSAPVARADWLVYQVQKEAKRALAYVKTPCGVEDRQSTFFLHVTPDAEQLSEGRAIHGFDNLDFHFEDAWGIAAADELSKEGWMLNDSCVLSIELPLYGIARIRTGQYTVDGRIWDVEIVFDDAT